MGILETLRGKLGVQPIDIDLTNSLRAAKKQSDAEKRANLKKAAEGQKAVELQYKQRAREKKATVDRLGQQLSLYKPILEVIKRTHLGRFRGKIVLEKDYEGENGAVLELKWGVHNDTQERGGGRSPSIVPVEKGKHFYFHMYPNGETMFGPVWGDIDENKAQRQEIDVNPNSQDWKVGLAEKIQQAITITPYGDVLCDYKKELPR